MSDILLLFSFFGRPTYGVFYKITRIYLSLRQFGIFLRNCSLLFFFWYWNICSKIFVSSSSEIFMKNFRTAIFLNIEKEFLCFVYFWQNLKRLSFQLKVYPLFHWSWYAIFITKAITEWTMFYMKTFSFVSSLLIK